MSGYGQLAYLTYPAAFAKVADWIHLRLALAGLIVLDPDPVAVDDMARMKLVALEKTKVRRADLIAVVHSDDGSLDGHAEDVVAYATTLGKPISHFEVGSVLDV